MADLATPSEPTTACRHSLCGGYRCPCSCHPGTPEQRAAENDAAVSDWLAELAEVTESRDRHAGHTLRQVGRCVYCSCGYRYQGTLPKVTP
jgi:hypothetical protein